MVDERGHPRHTAQGGPVLEIRPLVVLTLVVVLS